MNFSVKTVKTTYTTYEAVYIGKVKIGGVHYNFMRGKGEEPNYKVTCSLPGAKQQAPVRTIEEGVELIKKLAMCWVNLADLKPKEN